MELLLATRNRAKGLEMARLLVGAAGESGLAGAGGPAGIGALSGLRIRMLSEFPDAPEPVEDACTFKGNALIKARSAADHTGLWTVADDSGLTVAWLGGRPGVLSARYCGGHGDDVANNLKVLAEMAGAPEMLRGARFVAAVAIAAPGGNRTAQHVDACRTWVVEGECHGVIAHEMRGSGGFGYDSLFFVSRLEKTFAELSAAEKDALSHRGKAFAKARVLLAGLCVQ